VIKNKGKNYHGFVLGDDLYVIHGQWGMDLLARVLKIVDYPLSNGLKQPKLTISNIRRNIKDRVAEANRMSIEAQKAALNAANKATLAQLKANAADGQATDQKARLDLILDNDGNMTTQSKRLYITTHMYADNLGLCAVDSSDPEKYVYLSAGGIDITKGFMRLFRDDGYPIVQDGVAHFDFAIDSHEPPFTDGGIVQSGFWFKGNNYSWGNCNYYSYKHTARYLKVLLGVAVDEGGTGWARITTGAGQELWKYSHQAKKEDWAYITATVDLGVPDGQVKFFYVQLSTSDVSQYAYVRVLRKWLEG